MKRNLLFNQLTAIGKRLAMVLTMLLIVGIGQVWAETATYTLNSSNNGGSVTTGNVSWSIASGAITVQNSNCKLTGTITVTLPAGATLNKVSIAKSNTWGNGATVTFKTGSTTLNTFSNSGDYTLTTNKDKLTYTFTKSGDSSKNAWVKSITVDYTIASSGGGNDETPDDDAGDACGWVEADISEITSTDNVVITMSKGNNVWALANNNGTGSAPTALPITIANGEITPAEDDFNYNGYSLDHYTWNISTNSDALTFYPKGSTSTWLYCTGTNNGVRVGTNANKTFTIDASSGYLKHTSTSRYVGVYTTNPDWRCYTSTTTSNIAGQTLKFYKYVECTAEPTHYLLRK